MARPRLLALQAIQADLECYAVPYGLVGFISDAVTVYILLCLAVRIPKAPLFIRSPIRHSTYSRTLLSVALLGELVLNVYSMAQCRFEWQVASISAGRMLLSAGWTTYLIGMIALKEPGQAAEIGAQPLIRFGSKDNTAEQSIAPEIVDASAATTSKRARLLGFLPEPYHSQQPPTVATSSQDSGSPEVDNATSIRLRRVLSRIFICAILPVSLASMGLIIAGTVTIARISYRSLPWAIVTVFILVLSLPALLVLTFLCPGPCATCERRMTVKEYARDVGRNCAPLVMLSWPLVLIMADWVVAVVAKRWTGLPLGGGSGGLEVRYWLYFAVSKLPLLAL